MTPLTLPESEHTTDLNALLNDILHVCTGMTDGEVASYIPELAKADPDHFGLCVITTQGEVFEAGASDTFFTLQSMSKPFMYGLALEELGRDVVLQYVGVEPTGDAFNSIVLDRGSNRPGNPMVNAGALVTTHLVQGQSASDRLDRMLGLLSRYTGRAMSIDARVFTSETATADRNRAIAYLLRNVGLIDRPVDELLTLYLQQCAVQVSCTDLAWMAATLANGGQQPRTGVQALKATYVKDVLSVMYTCGMYDFAGQWAYHVGLPAKSGVSGGLLAVAPGRMGIGLFSPRLDRYGHSVRAVQACELLVDRLNLHIFG